MEIERKMTQSSFVPNPQISNDHALVALIAKTVDERLAAALSGFAALPPDAKEAAIARLAAKARGFFWVPEFAKVIGRHNQFVSDRCAVRAIRTLPGGKPYRIPLSEEAIWNRIAA